MLILANAALTISATTFYGFSHHRWETGIASMRDEINACRTTKVYALSSLSLLDQSDSLLRTVGTKESMVLTYRQAAASAGVPVEVLPIKPPVRNIASGCPTLLWIEHRYIAPQDLAALVRAANLRSATGRMQVRVLEDGPGWALLALTPVPAARGEL